MDVSFDISLYEAMLKQHLETALEQTSVKTPVPLRYHPLVDDYTMSCGWDRTLGGRIWLAWFAGGDNEKAVIVLAYSDDDGLHFSEPKFYIDRGYTSEGLHYSSVVGSIWTDPAGRLWIFYMQSLGYFDGRAGVWASVCENPDDEEPVWSKPQRIWHGCSLNKPTVLSDGTWLLPVALWKKETSRPEPSRFPIAVNMFPELDSERKSWIFASQDQGRTWTRRGGCVNAQFRSFDEPMLIERHDGSLMMMMRNEKGITESFSADSGYTWTEPVQSEQTNAVARFFLRKLSSGNVLLVRHNNPNNPMERSHLTAFISHDDGKTFQGGLLLDERSGISYPDGFQAPDGKIYIQYDRDRSAGEILSAVFREDEVEIGRILYADSRIQYPIMQGFTKRMIQNK